MLIIPAIDIIGGKCVRLTKGDYRQVKLYSDDPVAVAQDFEQAGIRRLHVVDLDGAKARHVVNIETLKAITTVTGLEVDFGGGVKTRSDLDQVFAAGARQITAGSIAASNFDEVKKWFQIHGPDKIILGADVLDEQIMVSGWRESSGLDLYEFVASYTDLGLKYVICTDISKDGVLAGPSFELYEKLMTRFPRIHLIASGGVSGKDDLAKLKAQGLYGAIVGKAFYEGRLTLEELKTI